MFNLLDHNRDSRVDMDELTKYLHQSGIRLGESQFESLFNLIDSNRSGKISYTELCDVIEGNVEPDIEAFVRAERAN
jgi:Ca2+-binding EF-hand superfamily protein